MGPVAYAAYRTGSGSIHGCWHDLVRNHIEEIGDGLYAPNFTEGTLRPQPLFAMALRGAECSLRYIEARFPDGAEELAPRYRRFIAKLRDADERHERYLAARQVDE